MLQQVRTSTAEQEQNLPGWCIHLWPVSCSLIVVEHKQHRTGNATRAKHNCHQGGFTQQLMETDAETHRKTVDGAPGIWWKRRED
ncbi:rCG61441 [Rattus norvegicus]|uniref:RCG61441 n=1 Tax=Rattus norvegicus TaxID=10116 RepID=A6HB31_RAT|nr:rCG61441 [Rattus norvegicus]